MPWSHIKIIALLLLLTMLAHDTVMAGDPHAVSHHQAHAQRSGGGSAETGGPHHASMTADGLAGHGPVLLEAGESPCGPVISLRPPSPPDLLPDRGTAGLIRSLPVDEASVTAPVRRDDPDHPPDVRRALLQVFLN
jgi:hypothetical protein